MINKSEIIKYLPKNKYDVSNIQILSEIGFPVLNCVLSELLFWVTDYNWPVAKEICLILKNADETIIPEIIHVLQENDDERIWFLINNVLPNLDLRIQSKLIGSIRLYESRITDNDYKENAIKYINEFHDFLE
jgi:hypothetical protein